MENEQPKSSSISQHKIRITALAGLVVGLTLMVFGGTSVFENLHSLQGSLTKSERLEEKILKNAKKATAKIDAKLQKAEEDAKKILEEAQKKAEKEKADIQKKLEQKLKDTADLSIIKEGPENILSQEDLLYRITISNAGPKEVNQVRFSEPLNDSLSFVTATVLDTADLASCTNIKNKWVCAITMQTALQAGESRVIEMRYRTHRAEQSPACETLFSTGPTTVESGSKKPIDPNSENNEAGILTTRIDCSDITADIFLHTRAWPSPITKEEAMFYTVGITNMGPNKSAHTKFKQKYSPNLQFVRASIQNCVVDENAHEVTCAPGDEEERAQGILGPSESSEVELEFSIVPDAPCELLVGETSLVSDADTVSGTIDPEASNNTVPLSTEMTCPSAE